MIVRGQKINDRYQILRTIGEGGMANVYLAHDTILDRDVAVKILRGDLADDEKFVRRFQREAISASSLSHPNIVEMYDVGEDDGKYYIVMEYVEGKTLKNLVKRRGALTISEVIDIMLQLTSAIACAHNSNIIHRDIKPQNVLVKEDGTIKITDFGIAMALNSNELTQTNSVMGSVHYLPPEQANGRGATVKSDIYSLGIVMFELLTGKLPFKGDNAVEIAIKQMKDQIPSVCNINSKIPQTLENIVLMACAKNPKNRYDSVSEMHEDIKTCLDKDRIDERRVVYKFSEQEELEATKELPNLKRFKKKNVKEEETEEMEPITDKKSNKVLIIMSLIVGLIAIIMLIILVLVPYVSSTKEIVVPDVSNMTIVEAEKKLKDLGFVINEQNEETSSDSVEEGKVIKTNPSSGVSRKKGTTLTLVVSTGVSGVVIENYVGLNYFEVKGKLEAYGLKVVSELKEVKSEENESNENEIIEQRPIAGTKLVSGDTVTLILPDVIVNYPDFVSEKWTLENIQSFCDQYKVILSKKEEETSSYEAGTILKQSRVAGTRVAPYVTLEITVAKEPEKKPEQKKEEKQDNTTNNTGTNGSSNTTQQGNNTQENTNTQTSTRSNE